MEFKTLINESWGQHEQDSNGVATRLEEHAGLADDAAKAAQLLAVANHTIGGHLHDWPRATTLATRVVAGLSEAPDGAVLGRLAEARFLSGDVVGALAAETCAAATASDVSGALGELLRVRALVVGGLVTGGRVAEAAALYGPLVVTAEGAGFQDDAPIVKSLALVSNNLASELLELDPELRSEAQDALMREAAEGARAFWLRAGTWVHDERSDYLLALVCNAVGDHAQARTHGERGLATIAANGEEPVDAAFLHLTLAGAAKGLDEDAAHTAALAAADALAEGFDEGLRGWYQGEREKLTG